MELSSSAIKSKFMNDINKLGPFGNLNFIPIFFIRNLKIIKFNVINNKHVSVVIKPVSGASIKAICFNCLNSKIGHYLLHPNSIQCFLPRACTGAWTVLYFFLSGPCFNARCMHCFSERILNQAARPIEKRTYRIPSRKGRCFMIF